MIATRLLKTGFASTKLQTRQKICFMRLNCPTQLLKRLEKIQTRKEILFVIIKQVMATAVDYLDLSHNKSNNQSKFPWVIYWAGNDVLSNLAGVWGGTIQSKKQPHSLPTICGYICLSPQLEQNLATAGIFSPQKTQNFWET